MLSSRQLWAQEIHDFQVDIGPAKGVLEGFIEDILKDNPKLSGDPKDLINPLNQLLKSFSDFIHATDRDFKELKEVELKEAKEAKEVKSDPFSSEKLDEKRTAYKKMLASIREQAIACEHHAFTLPVKDKEDAKESWATIHLSIYLALSKLDPSVPARSFSLKQLLDATKSRYVRQFAKKFNTIEDIQVDQRLNNVMISAPRVKDFLSALGNFYQNANRHMSHGKISGQIDFKRGNKWSLIVRDTGEGMDAETLKGVREGSGVSKGIGGHGVGLPQVRNMIQTAGGTWKVESELGKGSVFICDDLPASGWLVVKKHKKVAQREQKAEVKAEMVPLASPAKVKPQLAVHIVEDDSMNLKLLVRTLNNVIKELEAKPEPNSPFAEISLKVVAHDSPVEMTTLNPEALAETAEVLTDISMPFYNGSQLAAILRQQLPPEAKIHSYSGAPVDDDIFTGHIGKGGNVREQMLSLAKTAAEAALSISRRTKLGATQGQIVPLSPQTQTLAVPERSPGLAPVVVDERKSPQSQLFSAPRSSSPASVSSTTTIGSFGSPVSFGSPASLGLPPAEKSEGKPPRHNRVTLPPLELPPLVLPPPAKSPVTPTPTGPRPGPRPKNLEPLHRSDTMPAQLQRRIQREKQRALSQDSTPERKIISNPAKKSAEATKIDLPQVHKAGRPKKY